MAVGSVQLVTGSPAVKQQKRREAQDRVLALLAAGATVSAAIAAVGRRRETYYRWTREEDWFRDRAEAVRSKTFEEETDFAQERYVYFGFQTPHHQQRIIDVIEAAEPRSINMILLPPGAGKTTVLEDYYNIKLGRNPNWRFAVISETRDLGRKILRNVSNRMIDRTLYSAYIDRYGPFKPPDRELNKPWNSDVFTHAQANSGERDYSFEVKGAGSAIYGSSFDDIILDDIQSIRSLAKTPALLEYFRQTLFSRIMRANTTGRIFIIGTRIGPGDFYEELLRDDIVTDLIKIPALDEHGHSYFPKRTIPGGGEIGFDEHDLVRVKQVVGEEAWSRQYMQEPISQRSQTFSNAMIEKCLDRTRSISTQNIPGMYRIASLDPALAGHSSFKVASFDYSKLYLLDTKNNAGLVRYEEMYDEMEKLTIQWQPQAWIIEGNAIQGGLGKSERVMQMSEKYGFSVISHQTGRNKMDDIIGVASMAGTFLRNEISIPWGDDEASRSFAMLVDELRAWRPDVPTKLLRQDEVMALWFLHLHWHRMRSTLASQINRNINIGGLPGYTRYRPKVSA